MRSRSNMTKMLVCHLAWSLSLIFKTYLPALVQSAKRHCAIKSSVKLRKLWKESCNYCLTYAVRLICTKDQERDHTGCWQCFYLCALLQQHCVRVQIGARLNQRVCESGGRQARWLAGWLPLFDKQCHTRALRKHSQIIRLSACLPASSVRIIFPLTLWLLVVRLHFCQYSDIKCARMQLHPRSVQLRAGQLTGDACLWHFT